MTGIGHHEMTLLSAIRWMIEHGHTADPEPLIQVAGMSRRAVYFYGRKLASMGLVVIDYGPVYRLPAGAEMVQ